MLLMTYTLTALKIEQDRVRNHLQVFREMLAEDFTGSGPCSRNILEKLLHQIKRVHLNCSWRRLEVHVLPEIKGIATDMDLVLAELDVLRLLGLDLYRSARDRLRMGLEERQADTQELSRIMRMYCNTLQEMLTREEQRLFNEAFARIEVERWFSIAQRFMQLDKEMLESEEMGEVISRRQLDLHPSIVSKPAMESSTFRTDRPEHGTQAMSQEFVHNQLFPCLASHKKQIGVQGSTLV